MDEINIVLTYDQVYFLVQNYELTDKFLNCANWLAVARGGVSLTHMLAVKYDRGFHIIDPKQPSIPEFLIAGESVLLIEDVSNGGTIRRCKDFLHSKGWHEIYTLQLVSSKDDGGEEDAAFLDGRNVLYFLPWETEKAPWIKKTK